MYYVTFDDSYVKKLKATEEAIGEIFTQTGQVTASIANLFEQFVELFDEPEKATLSEAKAADNKVDHLKQIVEDAAKRMGEGEHVPNEPPKHGASVEGENPPSSKQPSSQLEGENSIPVSPESSTAPERPSAPESSTTPESPVAPESLATPKSSSVEEENSDMFYDDDS